MSRVSVILILLTIAFAVVTFGSFAPDSLRALTGALLVFCVVLLLISVKMDIENKADRF